MRKLINWCNQNGLYLITLFLLAFVPLYPKLPLIDITQTWVSIRFEDLFVALASLGLLIRVVRRRQLPNSPLSLPIVVYWIVGLVSMINALIFIFPHFGGVLFPHLAVLHFARRIEYMIMFFVAFEAFSGVPRLKPFLWTLGVTYLAVILYGFGQKFLGFPAFLTMNEEFAKGTPLRLPSTARFPSTFGGHYDLAAYLVMTIPIMGSLVCGVDRWWKKVLFFVLTVLGLIMLLFTASRVSFGVYLVVMSVMLFWQKKTWYIIPMVVASLLIMNLTSGVSERFEKTFRVSDVVVDLSTGKPVGTLASLTGTEATIEKDRSPAEETLPTGSEFVSLAGGLDSKVNTISYGSQTITGATGEVATVSGSFLIQKALVYDISFTTRFQGEWPKAIAAFKRNIFLGSGYSSLSVATDGDYHRMLGETGMLGALSFLGIFAVSFLLFFKRKQALTPLEHAIVVGIYAGIVGLLCNAVLIDVFEASKVAYTLWMLLGIATAILIGKKPFPVAYFSYLWRLATRKLALVMYLLLAIWIVWGKTYNLYFIGDDFTWLRWAAQSVPKDILTYFTNAQGFFYRPIPKLWYFTLFSIFWLKPMAYHIASIGLLSLTTLGVYHVMNRFGIKRALAWAGALVFAVLSVHHENVYWISGQSSQLAALFLIGAVVFRIESVKQKKLRWLWLIGSYIAVAASMCSYDGMIVAPVIVSIIGFMMQPKSLWNIPYLLFIPGYWWVRSYAHAVGPEGDYGYKWSTFFINSIANGIGYTIAACAGPAVVEWWNALRLTVKPYLKELSGGAVLLVIAVVRLVWAKRTAIKQHRMMLVWGLCYLIAFGAYVPLGGMAERYVYIPSMFLIPAIMTGIDAIWRKSGKVMKAISVVVLVGCIVWNVVDVQTVGKDWEKASSVVDQSLRVIKKEAWPPMNILHFYIVNIPIRYGRAWIYPTGMTDALWHMYRQNPYEVIPVASIQEGYSRVFGIGDRRVFIFEHYVLKKGVEEQVTK